MRVAKFINISLFISVRRQRFYRMYIFITVSADLYLVLRIQAVKIKYIFSYNAIMYIVSVAVHYLKCCNAFVSCLSLIINLRKNKYKVNFV